MSSSPAPKLADVAALAVALTRDEQRSAEERRAADRQIAETVGGAERGRVESALAWLEASCARDEELRARREQARAAFTWTGVVMMLLGLLVGWLAALGALYYDGSGRVNVVAVLAIFVLLPALLLIPFFLAALPGRILRWLPGATATGALARGLSPGRLGVLVLRRLPRDWRDAWERVSGRVGSHQTLYAGVQKWAVLRWSQLFALGFQLAAVTAACWLVVFSDLAFGWSTTLTSGDPAEDAARLHTFTSALAAPWGWAVEAAEPSLELIRESRYYRAVAHSVSPQEAARLGNWWPFLIASMLIYGLLPRVLTLILAEARLQTTLRAAIGTTPGLTTVLGRLHRAQVRTQADEPDLPRPAGAQGGNAAPLEVEPLEASFDAAISWSEVPVEDAVLSARLGGAEVWHAGGASSLEADQELVKALREKTSETGQGVAIAVKSWEPPLLDFIDFVRELRRELGDGREVVVVPVAVNEASAPVAAAPAHVEVWRRKLAGVGDPWLRVAEIPREVAG